MEQAAGGLSCPHIELRRALVADSSQVLAVRRRAIRGSAAALYGADALEAWAAGGSEEEIRSKIETTEAFVAVFGGRVIGWANLNGSEVDQLYVDPDFRGVGVARGLYETIEARAAVRGSTRLTAVASLRAIPVFGRFGFTVVRRVERVYNGHSYRVADMVKRLEPTPGLGHQVGCLSGRDRVRSMESSAPSVAPVEGWTPARAPAPVPLEGSRVRLEPLDPELHAEDLFAASHGAGADPALWDYLPYGPFADVAGLRAWLAAAAASRDPLYLALIDDGTGRACGQSSFLRAAPEHGSIEIGHIWIGTPLQRTPAATEALTLLVRHAFDGLGNRRLEWKCNAANARSRRAAERLGFTFEGVFRQHMVVKGHNRDTAWYAMLDHEWPRVRAAYDAWLAPGNFDADGRQHRALGQLL